MTYISVNSRKLLNSCARSQMRNKRDTMDYFLFFATNNELGLKKMKDAMWRVDESGTYTFSDATDPNQSVLFSAEPDSQLLTRLIVNTFGGTETTPEEIESFRGS
jgi:hypothetical protein